MNPISPLTRREVVERVGARRPVNTIDVPLIRYRCHAAQISLQRAGEAFRRRTAATLQLRVARELGLPLPLWVNPIGVWPLGQIPPGLRPRSRVHAAKQILARLLDGTGEDRG